MNAVGLFQWFRLKRVWWLVVATPIFWMVMPIWLRGSVDPAAAPNRIGAGFIIGMFALLLGAGATRMEDGPRDLRYLISRGVSRRRLLASRAALAVLWLLPSWGGMFVVAAVEDGHSALSYPVSPEIAQRLEMAGFARQQPAFIERGEPDLYGADVRLELPHGRSIEAFILCLATLIGLAAYLAAGPPTRVGSWTGMLPMLALLALFVVAVPYSATGKGAELFLLALQRPWLLALASGALCAGCMAIATHRWRTSEL